MTTIILDEAISEEIRLRSQRYQKLTMETPVENRLDCIVNFLAEEFDMPMAFISLFDEEWKWLNLQRHISKRSVLRDFFLVKQHFSEEKVIVFSDLKSTHPFSHHPLIAGTPYLRFFAGAPLSIGSSPSAGMLCMCDTRVRQFDDMDQAILCSLRDLVVAELATSKSV